MEMWEGKNSKKRIFKSEEKGKKNKVDVMFQHYLPEDVIFNILKRIPAKSLMRFKCVCKAWHALICDPYFAVSHSAYSQTRDDASYLLLCFVDRNLEEKAVFPITPSGVLSNNLPVHKFEDDVSARPCTNIANGLVCLLDVFSDRVEVLNLTTREKIALPQKMSIASEGIGEILFRCYFLGFDPFTKTYKVLYFCRRGGNGPDKERVEESYIHNLGTRSWRKMTDCPQFGVTETAICVDGAIYWNDKLFNGDGERVIQFFDVGEERFSLLSAPRGVAQEMIFMTEIEGKFALGRLDSSCTTFTLWRMNKGDHRAWVMEEIQLPEKLFSSGIIRVTGTSNKGKVLLQPRLSRNDDSIELIYYDLRTSNFRTRKVSLPGQALSRTFLSLAASSHVENILPLQLACDQQKKAQKAKKKPLAKGAKRINPRILQLFSKFSKLFY